MSLQYMHSICFHFLQVTIFSITYSISRPIVVVHNILPFSTKCIFNKIQSDTKSAARIIQYFVIHVL